ncbi:centromere protein T isoform X1 [Tamandua tetradactyla]|uniref:centromere protein T isoform X1 n=1 Tax=Tamandua tetradactyla TaxID=48850 RepID=UPI0040549CC2
MGLCDRLARISLNATGGNATTAAAQAALGRMAEAMAHRNTPDGEPTTRTLLRRVLDTADPRTPQRPGSARACSPSVHSSQRRRSLGSAQRALLETTSYKRLSNQTKATARRRSYRARAIGQWSHVQASGHLEEQTPRTLLKNILLTAPESSIVMPESAVQPVQEPQVVQPSRRESSRGSLELQFPEFEPPVTLAPGLLAPGRRKQRLRLSVFQQGVDQDLPLSQEPHGNTDASSFTRCCCPDLEVGGGEAWGWRSYLGWNLAFSLLVLPHSMVAVFQKMGTLGQVSNPLEKLGLRQLTFLCVSLPPTSSLNLTFATPLQPQSVQRPGLARRPPTRRPVDVGAFLQDLRDTSQASVPLGDSHRTPVATLPTDTVLEDTQPFSHPLVSHRTWSNVPELQNNSSGKPAQSLAGRAEEVNVLDVGFPNTSSGISGEGGLESLEVGISEKAEERMEEGLSVSEVKEATGVQGSAREEEHEGHTEITEAEGSQGAIEAMEPEGSSRDEDTSSGTASPELASSTPEFLRARQLHLELSPPTSAADLGSEPLEPLSVRLPPRSRTARPRPRQDPYKAGLSHYAKLFSFYAKMPMEKKALEMVEKCLDKYFQHLCDDLEVFAAHAGRKTVRPEDLELLMRRQGLVTDQVSLYVLVERHLPLEYRQLLIPCAFSGNSVFPAQ